MEGRGLEEEDEERSGGWRREKEEGERVEEGLHLLVTIIAHICWVEKEYTSRLQQTSGNN